MITASPWQRFVTAQDRVWPQVVAELRAGEKRTHWMWFVFPQIAGLGHSAMAQEYALGSLEEARAYLAHAVLGPRLIECCEAVLAVRGRTLNEIFGWPDELKFRSSMTLFARAGGSPVFQQALDRYCGGEADPNTLARL